MLGRIFLLVLSLISLVWIVLVGFDLLDKRDFISPERIFTPADGEILIVNRSAEVHLEQLTYKISPQSEALYMQLLKKVYPKEQLYAAENSSIIIIGQSKVWTESSVRNYFKIKGIEVQVKDDKSLRLGNGFEGRYKRNFLLLHAKGKEVIGNKKFQWPLWDHKASASIIQLNKPLKSTNVYFRSNGTVSYQTRYGRERQMNKVDDADLFAQVIPAEATTYHFFEKEHALILGEISTETALFKWLETGFVQFDYLGSSCIVSDYKKTVDVEQLLATDENANNTKKHYVNVRLTKSFPKNLRTGFHLAYIADKIIVSESEEVLNRILTHYEIGNTLALSERKSNELFGKLPRKVSERSVSSTKKYTLTAYKNLLIKTEQFDQGELPKAIENKAPKNLSFSVNGTILNVFDDGEITYCITSENTLLAFSNRKQIWKYQLDSPVIGQAQIIDIYANGYKQVLLNTAKKIYVISSKGDNVNDFPVSCSSVAPVSNYRWGGKSYFVLVSSESKLIQLDQQGRVLQRIRLTAGTVTEAIDVYRKGTILAASINGHDRLKIVDMEKYSLVKDMEPLRDVQFSLKEQGEFVYYTKKKDGIWVSKKLDGTKNERTDLAEFKNIQKQYLNGENYLCAFGKKQVMIQFPDGNIIRFPAKIEELLDVDVIKAKNGKTYIAVLDGIENNIYLYDSAGNKIELPAMEGQQFVKLSEQNGKIIFSTSLQKSLVQYYREIP